MRLYKLTDEQMRTFAGTQWEIGIERAAPGDGLLCTSAWLHAYEDWLVGLMLNPIHANIANPRLFEAEGVVGIRDYGLKVGCTNLTLIRELPVPPISTTQRIAFGIRCAAEVYENPDWLDWCDLWLSGDDRSVAAVGAASASAAAMGAASGAARAAVGAAWAAATMASAMASARAAAMASARAAAAAPPHLDLPAIARMAMEVKP